MKQRILSLALVLAMVLSMFPATAVSAEENTRTGSASISVQANPLYAGIVDPETIVLPETEREPQLSAAIYVPADEAAVQVRNNLKSRTSAFTIYVQTIDSDREKVAKEVFHTALSHTGNPIEGDYLKWQYAGWEAQIISSYDASTGIAQMKIDYAVEYYTTAAQEMELNDAIDNVLDELDLEDARDYEKICGIYDYICSNVAYDTTNVNNKSNTIKYTAYGALINGKAVCQGYAVLLYRLALALGVDNRLIAGVGNGEAHGWNIVELKDLYYNVDATWDAGAKEYGYFLLSDANFKDHTRYDEYASETFYAAYPMGKEDYVDAPDHVHSYTESVVNPTCTEKGYTTFTCACGDSYKGNEVDALGHSFSDGICSVCEAEDPDYTAPTEPTETEPVDPNMLASGTWGEGITWKLSNDGLLTISGKGNPEGATPWAKYKSIVLDLVVESGITSIPDYAFDEHPNLKAAKLPEGILHIGMYAFAYCPSLTSITLPDSLTVLDDDAFIGCTALSSVKFGNSLKTIGVGAFSETALTEVVIPDSVTTIEQYCFYHCAKLEKITLSKNLTEITSGLLEGTAIASLDVPASVQKIGFNAFANCAKLEYVVIPDSVIEIDENAFYETPVKAIHCYAMSYAHLYAESCSIPAEILDEAPETALYTVTILTPNGGGKVEISSEKSPANRFVLIQATPDKGRYLESLYYSYDIEGDLDLQFEAIGDNQFVLFMPACNLELEFYFGFTESPFTDVKESDYFFEPVLWAVSHGITSGMSATKFGSGNACTRAQVVTFLWAAAGKPEPQTTENPFTDVKETDYFYKAVLWAVENGITSGMSATKFGSTNVCTRAQVVTFLYKTFG